MRNKQCVGEFNGRRLYIHTGLRLDYRFRLWAHTSASRAIFAIAELSFLFKVDCPMSAYVCTYYTITMYTVQ